MILILSLLLIVSLFSLKLTNRLNLPILLIFLLVGIVAGSDMLNLVYFDNMLLTQQIANIALIFVIFDSGFNLRRETIKSIFAPSLILATAGVIATAFITGLFIHFFLKFDLLQSLLIGSIISSTDASAVVNAMRSSPVRQRLSNTLIFESAANDPAAIILTIFFIQLIQIGKQGNMGLLILNLVWQISGGIGIGLVIGITGLFLFRLLKSENRGYYFILMIGICLCAYGMATLIKANGIIAVFFCGIYAGNSRFPFKKGVESFMDAVASFSNISLFLLLGLLAFPKQLPPVLGNSIVITLFVIFIARTIVTFLVTPFFKYGFKESLFICFAGIKGAVPIVLATYPAANGLDNGHLIFNIVFVIVFISLLLQGTLIKPISRLLKLNIPQTKKSEFSFELLSINDCTIDIFEHKIDKTSFYCNKKLHELNLPQTVSITSVIRDKKIIVPRGNTRIQEDDIIYILATEEQFTKLKM